MDLIILLVALVLVAIVTIIVQRKWGSRRLLWVWIASAVITTSAILFWFSYNYGSPISGTRQQILSKVVLSIGAFISFAILFGVEVGLVSIFGPRPPQSASAEVNYFPFDMPLGGLENTDGLTGILRRYQELLSIFATTLDTALGSTPFNPYQSMPRSVLGSFRRYSPTFLRQARVSSAQFDQVPNALMRDLAGADAVLTELEKLTPAQLSASEECHRVNMKRLRQRSVLRWDGWGSIATISAIFITMIKYGADAAEQLAGVKPSYL
jgi:4-amino-4-deoxy-L-arabinose transferase-like glycosyltransferase